MEKVKTKIKSISISKQKFFIFSIIFALFFVVLPSKVDAATLYLYPASKNLNKNDTFSVNVNAASPEQAINAVSGVVSFPSDKLRVLSVTKGGSVVSLWVQEPSFSNGVGTVNFEGIILNPGWRGAAGNILTINFEAKSTGSAKVKYSSGSILANDGQGTNILTGMSSATYRINVPTVEPPRQPSTGPPAAVSETPAAQSGTPAAPQVTSLTHPDTNAWHSASTPSFQWNLDESITAVRLLVSNKPNSSPSVIYDTPINQKELDEMEDGVWYFHVQLKNSAGWGSITHFRFQVDTKDPEYFNMSEIPRANEANPIAQFNFDAVDELSGIKHYLVQIDGGDPEIWVDDGSHIYTTQSLNPGKHTLIAKALDGAGNAQANYLDFVVGAIEAPRVEKYSKNISSKDIFAIQGTTYPNSNVTISMQRELDNPELFSVMSDENGRFIFIADKRLHDGIYSIWLEVVDENGARSNPTNELVTVVRKPSYQRIGEAVIAVLSVAIPLIALVVLLVLLLLYSYRKLMILREQIRKEAGEAQTVLHREFTSLKKKLSKQIETIEKAGEKRKLTRKEAAAINKMKSDLTASEKKVEKEIADIQQKVAKKK